MPINFSWQKFLERRWPGFPRSATAEVKAKGGTGDGNVVVTVEPADLLPASVKEKDEKRVSSWRWRRRWRRSRSGLGNFLMKFILDQTVGSVMNILLFIVLINMLKGVGWRRIGGLIVEVCLFLPSLPLFLSGSFGMFHLGEDGLMMSRTSARS